MTSPPADDNVARIGYATNLYHRLGDRTEFYAGRRGETQHFEEVDGQSNTPAACPDVLRRFRLEANCLYCGKAMAMDTGTYYTHGYRSDRYGRKGGFQCARCGWWFIQVDGTTDDDEADYIEYHLTTYEGIVCRFDPGPWNSAIASTSLELAEWKQDLSQVTPREMERLIAGILGQYHSCDVHHVGRSGDRGIDLLIVKSDSTVPVQVKHRQRRGGSEGVAVLRDFVGAIVGEGYREGVFVTTAMGFSRHAEQYADRARRARAPINLISIERLRELIADAVQKQSAGYDIIWANWSGPGPLGEVTNGWHH